MPLRGRPRRALIVGVCLYVVLWLLTELFGAPQVRRAVIRDMAPPTSYEDASRGTGPLPPRWYACGARALVPLLILVDHTWHGGPLSGGSARELYIWFFGLQFRVYTLEEGAE